MQPALQPPLGHFCLEAFHSFGASLSVPQTQLFWRKNLLDIRDTKAQNQHIPRDASLGWGERVRLPLWSSTRAVVHLSPTKAAILCLLEHYCVRKCNEWVNKHIKQVVRKEHKELSDFLWCNFALKLPYLNLILVKVWTLYSLYNRSHISVHSRKIRSNQYEYDKRILVWDGCN